MANYQPKPTGKRFKDHEGKRFGRLIVLGYVGKTDRSIQIWECRCDCGTVKTILASDLQTGNTKSCGCLRRDAGRMPKVHGMAQTRTYRIYRDMLRRCHDPRRKYYADYGGRGITVCDKWRGPNGFAQFIEDLGECPNGHSLERVDVDGYYCPQNCKWIPRNEQAFNRRNTIRLTVNGRTMRIPEWAAAIGISQHTIESRLQYGWSEHDAVLTPVRKSAKSAE